MKRLRALLLIALIALAAVSVWRSQQPIAEGTVQAQFHQLPVLAAKFSGGVTALAQGAHVELVAAASDGSLPPQTFSTVQVARLLDAGQTVLLALAPEEAGVLQEMLLRDKVTLSYRLLPPPTATPTGPWEPAEVATPSLVPAAGRVPLAIKLADLSAGLPLATLREYRGQPDKPVTLLTVHETGTDPNKIKVTEAYTDVLVLDLLDANGASIADTITVPDRVLLSVPEAHFDALAKRVLDKKALYLLDRPVPTPPPSQAPQPTPTPAVDFDVPISAIQSDVSALARDDKLVLIVVVSEKDLEGKVLRYVSHDLRAVLVEKTADSLRVSLALQADQAKPANDFAAYLSDPSAQYYVWKGEP